MQCIARINFHLDSLHPISRLVQFYQTHRQLPYPSVTHVSYTTLDGLTHSACYDGLVRDRCELPDTFKVYVNTSHVTQDTRDWTLADYAHGRNCCTFLLHELNIKHLDLPTLPGPLLDAILRRCIDSDFFNGYPYYDTLVQGSSK